MLYSAKRFNLYGWLSPVVLCYLAGIAINNLHLFPLEKEISETATMVTIPLAIPLLLFSTNIPLWLKQARSMTISFLLSALSVTLSCIIYGLAFSELTVDSWIISAMFAGGLTGSAPNMNAVGLALEAPEETLILVNASDIVTGGFYLIFLTSVAQRALNAFLPSYVKKSVEEQETPEVKPRSLNFKTFIAYVKPALWGMLAFGLTYGVSLLLGQEENVAFFMFVLTLISVGFSFVDKIRRLDEAYDLGQYLLLMFCVAIGMQANFRELMSSSGVVFLFGVCILGTSLILHYLLSWFFKLDTDTVIITSTASIYGPVFIGQIAVSLNNREIIFPGIITSLIGNAVGYFLGMGVAYLLRYLL